MMSKRRADTMSKAFLSKSRIFPSLLLAVLTATAAYCGAFVPSTYSKESLSWAAQGIGQDYVTLFFVVPILLISAYFVSKGSLKAFLVWLGSLIYIAYSYILYAFFIHFSWIFLLYVAILGISFYTIVGSLYRTDIRSMEGIFQFNIRTKVISGFLMFSGVMFMLLWLSDIITAVISGTLPKGVAELGFLVNPVHVLDLAFFLPGSVITSVLLWKRDLLGAFFAVPMMIFQVLMGAAIVSMVIVLNAKTSEPLTAAYIMSTLSLASLFLVTIFFRDMTATKR